MRQATYTPLGPGAALLVGLLLAAGCAGDSDPILLEVAAEQVPLSVFQKSFWEVSERDTTIAQDTGGVAEFLETYIEKELMEHLAAEHVSFDEEMQDRLERYKEELVQRLLSQRVYGDVTTVSEADLRDAYEKLGTQFHIREIIVSSEEDANRTRSMIEEGAVFGKVAAGRSLDQETAAKEGDRGWVTLGQIPLPVYEALEKLQPGDMSPVIRSSLGFHIVLLEGRRESDEILPFEDARDVLERSLLRERIAQAVLAFNSDLRTRYQYEIKPQDVIWIANWLRDATAAMPRGRENVGQATTVSAGELINRMEEDDRLRVLATTTRDTINCLLLVVELSQYPTASWPTFDSPEDVIRILESMMILRMRLAESERLGLYEDPDLLWQTGKRRDAILSRQFYLRYVRPETEPTEDEVFAAYDAQYGDAEPRRRYLSVDVGERDVAAEVSRRLSAGEGPEAVYEWASGRDETARWTGAAGTRYYTYGESPDIDDVLFALGEGDVSDPIPVNGRFTVLKLLDIRTEAAIPYDRIRSDLKLQLWDDKANRLLDSMMEAARDTLNVTVHREVLSRVKPSPPEGWIPPRRAILGSSDEPA